MGAREPLDLSEMPEFRPPDRRSPVGAALPQDLGLLVIEGLLFFTVAFIGFLRYDVR